MNCLPRPPKDRLARHLQAFYPWYVQGFIRQSRVRGYDPYNSHDALVNWFWSHSCLLPR
jgi:hypothetical protein